MDLTKLNAVAKVDRLELKKLNSMTVIGVYPIKNMWLVKTKKYREKVIIQTDYAQYCLPSRVSQHLLCNHQKGPRTHTMKIGLSVKSFVYGGKLFIL